MMPLLAAAFVLLGSRPAFAQSSGLTVGTNLVDITQAKGNETDPFIAINPLNPSNMVVVAATDGTVPGMIVAITTNLGATWATNFIGTNTNNAGLTPAAGPYAEPSAAFDSYSNLYVAYLPNNFQGIAIAVSTDGGASFASLTNLAPLDVTDQPRITAPATGADAGSVWVVYKDYTTADTPLQVQGLVSTGPGAIGTFGNAQIVPGSGGGGFADISVGPLGQALVAFQDNLDGEGAAPGVYPAANVFVSAATNTIADGVLTYNPFSQPVIVASNAVGGVTYIPAAPAGIGINASPGLAWNYNSVDPGFGGAYLIYTAVGPNGNAVIAFNSSSAYGASATNAIVSTNGPWSGQTFVDDDATNGDNGTFNDHFFPHMAVDPVSGIIACSWYDCRNDQGANSPTIVNVVQSTNMTFKSLSMVTNINFTNNINSSALISEVANPTPDGNATNFTIIIVADDVASTTISNDSSANVYIGTNFVINFQGTNSGSSSVMVILTNIITKAYTSGNGANQEAIMYEAISTNDGAAFEPNQQLNPANQNIVPPAKGIASSVTGAKSLTGWGHYTGMAAFGGSFFPVWADNSDATTNNPGGAGGNFDIYMISTAPGSGNGVAFADLSITVTNTPNPVISQEVLTYSLIVANHGPGAAPPPILVTNILSPFLTLVPNSIVPTLGGSYFIGQTTNHQEEIIFVLPSMNSGVVVTNTFRVSASVSAIATNVATVYSTLLDVVPANNSNSFVVVVEGEDLAMGLAASETNVLVGDTVLSAVTVTNLGPATNGPVFITNAFSSCWTNVTVIAQGTNQVTNSSLGQIAIVNLGLLPVGQPVTAFFTAEALSGVTTGSELAVVTSQDIDTNLANNGAVLNYFINDENLAIGITSSSPNVDQSVPFTYAISVTNLGLSYSGLITVTSSLTTNLLPQSASQSQGSNTILLNQGRLNQVVFSLGSLGAGQVATMTITADPLSLPHFGTNTVTVSSTDFDLDEANNTVSGVVVINTEDVAVGVTASPPSPQVGQTVTFTTIVTNLGASAAGQVMVTNTLSSRLTSIAVLQPASGYTINGGVVTANLGALGVGQTATLVVTALATSAGSASDSAKAGSQIIDTNTANNSAAASFTITAPTISNLSVTPMASSAFIVFDSSSPSTAQVQYGLTTSYGQYSQISAPAATHHSILLTGLQEGAAYDYKLLVFVGTTTVTNTGSFTTTNVLILNTQDARYTGLWLSGQVATGIFGAYYQYTTTMVFNASSFADYAPALPASGLYNVSIWYPSGPSFTANAQVSVIGATNQYVLSVNQTINGGAWQPLAANVYFTRGTNGGVLLSNDTGENNRVLVANAMMWSYDSAQDFPTNGAVPAWWANFYFGAGVNGNVDGSAIASNGYSIFDNYVLGTDPTSATSALAFNVTPVSSNVVSISFAPYAGGRQYSLQASTDLSSPNWTTLTNVFAPGTNGVGTFTVTGPGSASSFYRLSAYVIPTP
ncbi:MAG TPA: hypothetical protein VGO59_19655 [Verrucomicrobiae bacterium]|jgi:uncharacterized repeat protein (TIGR01451 family)